MRFKTRFVVDVELELSDRLLDEVMTPEWQASFYRFVDRQAAADHVAYNLARGASLTSLDGFAHLGDGDAVIKSEDWEVE